MNKGRFKRIFSKRLGALVAVGEQVKAQGKEPGQGDANSPFVLSLSKDERPQSSIIAKLAALPFALALANPLSALAQSLPTGGNVVGGTASIGQTGNTMTIDQTTNRAAINWQTFNIGTGYTVQFNQPGTQSITLNRVVGGVPSNIQGALLANGQVWIQNANGVLFGSGATINVNSLLVTTKNIDVNQFMSGSNTFDLTSTGINAGIVNDGSIAAAGYVTLVGDQVRNTGNINAKQVTLAAGDSATVALDNGQGISITLTNATANALIENSGKIQTGNDGTVLLTAQGKDTLLDTVINLSGVVKANTIVADAGNTGDITVTGNLDASNVTGAGGTVVLSGNRVGLFNDAVINVSGDTQGGLVIIGGDNLNKVPGSGANNLISCVTLADYTQVDAGVKIDAGSAHGDGGFVETSGYGLSVQGTITASAPNGKAGLWLIDPSDINIVAGVNGTPGGGSFSGGAFTPSGTTATITNQTITTTLNAGTNVFITTESSCSSLGNIVVGADINTTGNNVDLTLLSNRSITVNNNITAVNGGKLNLNLSADAEGLGLGNVTIAGTSTTINLNYGALTIWGTCVSGTGVTIAGTLTNIGSGTITGGSSSSYGVFLSGAKTFTNSTLTISGESTNNMGVYVNGNLLVNGGSNITITGMGGSTSGSNITGGGVTLVGNLTVTDGRLTMMPLPPVVVVELPFIVSLP
ncbi:MAG: filamentous hemagglutinin N-terminal domain-containing protein, partial [Methylobacillus sp.]|nr:filamentous hemagglutinin N-terminal domain-containing protein [Methylobacillus sp.]